MRETIKAFNISLNISSFFVVEPVSAVRIFGWNFWKLFLGFEPCLIGINGYEEGFLVENLPENLMF